MRVVELTEDQKKAISVAGVQELWKVTIQTFGLLMSERKTLIWVVAVPRRCGNQMDAFNVVKNRFSGNWWENKQIISLEPAGELHFFNGIPLYERD